LNTPHTTKDDIDRNNKVNKKITIISKEQTVVHHSNRHVDEYECVQNCTNPNPITYSQCTNSVVYQNYTD